MKRPFIPFELRPETQTKFEHREKALVIRLAHRQP